MKKLFYVLLVLCLIFLGVAGFAQKDRAAEPPAGESPAPVETTPAEKPAETAAVEPEKPAETTAAEPETSTMKHMDLEALHGLYPEDSVYALIGEREITGVNTLNGSAPTYSAVKTIWKACLPTA